MPLSSQDGDDDHLPSVCHEERDCRLCLTITLKEPYLLDRWSLEFLHHSASHDLYTEWRAWWAGSAGWERKRTLPKTDRKQWKRKVSKEAGGGVVPRNQTIGKNPSPPGEGGVVVP
jgi:hypothetical protein